MGLNKKNSYVFIHSAYNCEYLPSDMHQLGSGDKIMSKTHNQACENMHVVRGEAYNKQNKYAKFSI